MSTSRRKVKKYVLRVVDNRSGKVTSGSAVMDIFRTALSRPAADRVFDDPKKNKFYILDFFQEDGAVGLGYFISAKYNHRPDLISKLNLRRRPNPKMMEEGESEKTHIGLVCGRSDAIFAMEAKGGGVSIGPMLRYFAKGSIKKYVRDVYKLVGSTKSSAPVTRVKVHGKSEETDDFVVDTERLTDFEYIDVELDGNGQVITESFLPRLRGVL